MRAHSPGSRRRRVLSVLMTTAVVAVTCLFGAAAPASAGFSGASGGTGCNAVNMARDATVGVYYVNTSLYTSALNWTLSTNLNATDVTPTVLSSSSGADVLVYEGAYTDYCGYDWYQGVNGTIGLTTCGSLLSNDRCNLHTIRLSTTYANDATTWQERDLACHETGHSVGLTHTSSTSSCMYSGSDTASSYNSTDVGYLNSAY
jgi:hypothetical protein